MHMRGEEMGNTYKVYKLTSPSGKKYIGITKNELKKRFNNGRGYKGCPGMAEAIKKYGWKSFRCELLYDGLTKEEAEQKEIDLISYYKSNQKEYGYNIENGGNVCGTHSEATRKKISEKNKGKKRTAEQRKQMSLARKGKQTGEENPFYGRRHTEENKKKQSDFMKGNKCFKGHHHSDEFKKMKSKQMHEKYKDGGNPRCKPVLHFDECGNLIERFYSLRQASRESGIDMHVLYKRVHDSRIGGWCYE